VYPRVNTAGRAWATRFEAHLLLLTYGSVLWRTSVEGRRLEDLNFWLPSLLISFLLHLSTLFLSLFFVLDLLFLYEFGCARDGCAENWVMTNGGGVVVTVCLSIVFVDIVVSTSSYRESSQRQWGDYTKRDVVLVFVLVSVVLQLCRETRKSRS
jgi:hypothetical protein